MVEDMPNTGPAEAFASWVTTLITPTAPAPLEESWLKRARAVSGHNMYTYADSLETKAFDRLARYRATPAPTRPAQPEPAQPLIATTAETGQYAGVAGP